MKTGVCRVVPACERSQYSWTKSPGERAVVINAELERADSVGSSAAQTASGSNVCAHSSSTRCEVVASIAALGVAGTTFKLR
jgi:hypothetical protein